MIVAYIIKQSLLGLLAYQGVGQTTLTFNRCQSFSTRSLLVCDEKSIANHQMPKYGGLSRHSYLVYGMRRCLRTAFMNDGRADKAIELVLGH